MDKSKGSPQTHPFPSDSSPEHVLSLSASSSAEKTSPCQNDHADLRRCVHRTSVKSEVNPNMWKMYAELQFQILEITVTVNGAASGRSSGSYSSSC